MAPAHPVFSPNFFMKDGNRLALVPGWQFSASGAYTLPGIFGSGESYVSVLWQYVGDRITQPGLPAEWGSPVASAWLRACVSGE